MTEPLFSPGLLIISLALACAWVCCRARKRARKRRPRSPKNPRHARVPWPRRRQPLSHPQSFGQETKEEKEARKQAEKEEVWPSWTLTPTLPHRDHTATTQRHRLPCHIRALHGIPCAPVEAALTRDYKPAPDIRTLSKGGETGPSEACRQANDNGACSLSP